MLVTTKQILIAPTPTLHHNDSIVSSPEEDISFAHDMSRSFSTRKDHYNLSQLVASEIHPSHDLPKHTPKFTNQPQRALRKSSTVIVIKKVSEEDEKVARRSSERTLSENMTLSKIGCSSILLKEEGTEPASPLRFLSRADSEICSSQRGLIRAQSLTMSPSRSNVNEEVVDVFEDEESIKEKAMRSKRKVFVENMLNSKLAHLIIGVFTVYALFADDVRLIVDLRTVDLAFDILNIVTFFLFSAEICLTWYVEKQYMCSFFFWLDLLSTLSLVFDVEFLLEDLFPTQANDSAQVAEASRASRIATKQGRIVQIIRLVQLAKLYKEVNISQGSVVVRERPGPKIYPDVQQEDSKSNQANPENQEEQKQQEQEPQTERPIPRKMPSGLENESGIEDKGSAYSLIQLRSTNEDKKSTGRLTASNQEVDLKLQSEKELRVGKKLTDLTAKRVIVIVLALLIVIPLFSADFYVESSDSQKYQMELLASLIDNTQVSEASKDIAIVNFIAQHHDTTPYIVYFRMGDTVLYLDPEVDITHLKHSQTETVSILTQTRGEIISITSVSAKAKFDGALGIGRIIFVCCALTIGALLISKDTNQLILCPLERIIHRVNRIARDPLMLKEKQNLAHEEASGFLNETAQLENAIIKIGRLLVIGFGEAGASIITQNIGASGDMSPTLPGKKSIAIFGFCDIRNFAEITEGLQEEVLVFVNSIADIVHSMVDKFAGGVSKNTGEAFLLVWKFPEDAITECEDGFLDVMDNRITQNVADCALMSFLKIYARVNRDPTLLAYRDRDCLLAKQGNYHVKMGFGLHVGWAIEGAIGSDYKIDASYISPHVIFAANLKEATNQYGVPLLFSGDIYTMISSTLKEKARMIDVVAPRGSGKPVDLYTIDMNTDGLHLSKERKDSLKGERKLRHEDKKSYIREVVANGEIYPLIGRDKELKHLFKAQDQEFNSLFSDGLDKYLAGGWTEAKITFEECLKIKKEDGPTRNLLDFMRRNDYVAPTEWAGFRNLD